MCLSSSRLHLPPGCRELQGLREGQPQIRESETLSHHEEKRRADDHHHWAATGVKIGFCWGCLGVPAPRVTPSRGPSPILPSRVPTRVSSRQGSSMPLLDSKQRREVCQRSQHRGCVSVLKSQPYSEGQLRWQPAWRASCHAAHRTTAPPCANTVRCGNAGVPRKDDSIKLCLLNPLLLILQPHFV